MRLLRAGVGHEVLVIDGSQPSASIQSTLATQDVDVLADLLAASTQARWAVMAGWVNEGGV